MSKIKHMYGAGRGGGEGRAERGGSDVNCSLNSQHKRLQQWYADKFFCASFTTSLFLKEKKKIKSSFFFLI